MAAGGETTGNAASPGCEPSASSRPLLLLVLSLSLLWGCWRAPFLPYDDPAIANGKAYGRDAPWSALFRPEPFADFYQPLTALTLRIDREVWERLPRALAGPEPWPTGIRTGNWLLHCVSALLVFGIFRRLGAGGVAAFAAIAFALHPTAVETAAWAAERKNALAACLGFAAVFVHVRASGGAQRAGAALLFVLALLAKASALGLLAVLIVWEALGRPDAPTPPLPGLRRAAEAVSRLLPWLVAAAGMTLVSVFVGERAVIHRPGGSLIGVLLTDVPILGRYAWNWLWPAGLATHYGILPAVSLLDPRVLGWGAFLLALVAGSILLCRAGDRRLCVFAWLWAGAALGPNLNLVGINDLMHDRFAYLSAPGFWLALGLAARGLAARVSFPSGRSPALLLVLLAVFWADRSAVRSRLWSDALLLFDDTVTKEPASAGARFFLFAQCNARGALAARERDPEAGRRWGELAFGHLEACVRAPDFDRFYNQAMARAMLGRFYFGRGRFDEAEAEAKAALDGRFSQFPNAQAQAHYLRALLAQRRGAHAEAVQRFGQSLACWDLPEALLGRHESQLALAREAARAGDAAAAARLRAAARASLLAIPLDSPLGPAARERLDRAEE